MRCQACDKKVRWTFFHCREAEIADISEKREQKRYINKKLYQTLVKKTGEEHAWGNMTGVRPTKMIMERLEEGSSEEEIIRVYGKRWQIEVFFKTCKSMLNLIGECHSLSYDALTAHVAIVFTRYMLFAMEQRQNEDQRTLGELFFLLVDEMTDITFNRSLGILMDALMASLQEILKLSDEQLTAFTADFEARLPEYLRNALHPKAVAA